MGTRDMDSTPPATTTSYCPAISPAAAECTDCWDEPHWRSMVKPGTLSGHPAARTAVRAMHAACSWAWDTHPQMTSSTMRGIDPAPLGQSLEHVRRQIRRVHAGQPSVALADRRPDGLHDHCITHVDSFG